MKLSKKALCHFGTVVFLTFFAALALAQGQSLSILVTDDSGAPLAQSLVVVQNDSGQGPAPAETGDDGRVSFELEAGEWQVDVRREGFMIYTGYVSLEPGKRPELGFSSKQRTGSFWAPLRVSFSGGGSDAVFAASRKEEKAARKREEQRLKSQARAERRAARGNLARTVEPKERQVDERQDSRVEPPAPEVTESEPQPESAAEESPTPEATVPVRTTSRAEPAGKAGAAEGEADEAADIESTEAAPRRDRLPASRPAAPRPATMPGNLLRAGACQECQPREWALLATVTAASLNSVLAERSSARTVDICTPGAGKAFSDIADLIAEHLPRESWGFAGPLQSADGESDLLSLLDPAIAQQITALLGPLRLGAESCPVVAAILPAGSKYVGYRYRVAEGKRESDCLSTEECLLGEARWRADPGVEKRDFGILVHSQFENSSKKNEREAELRVYFVPPDGWLPSQ